MQPDQSPDLRSEAWVGWAGQQAAPATELAALLAVLAELRTISAELKALSKGLETARELDWAFRRLT